jgi:hypothetical protein
MPSLRRSAALSLRVDPDFVIATFGPRPLSLEEAVYPIRTVFMLCRSRYRDKPEHLPTHSFHRIDARLLACEQERPRRVGAERQKT